MLKHFLQLGNAGVQLALLVLGLVILAVLGQVAETPGHFDLLGHLVGAGGLQIVQFLLELQGAGLTHSVFFFHICRFLSRIF